MQYSMICGLLAAAILGAGGAAAQQFPVKAVRLVVPAPAGSAPDFLSRALGQKLTEQWGQTVVIDNIVGASGHIGTERVAKSVADGYTLLFNTIGPIAVNQSLFGKLPFDPVKDFVPVTLVAKTPNILGVHPSLPAKSVKELISLARRNPGKLHYGSAGSGTTPHLSGALFATMLNLQLVHVPYKSSAQMTIDAIGGQVEVLFHNSPVLQPHVQSGKLRGLAVTSTTRIPSINELPTMVEAGVPGFEVTAWFGVLAPTGTPQPILTKLHGDLVKLIQSADMRERFMTQAAEPVGNRPEEFAAFIQSEIAKWAKVVKASGAKAE